jgi:2-hydroxymuconate-semialdehyde hydrolase
MVDVQSRFILLDGLKTHYLEAGSGPAVILLHSGEFGGCAELSWEFNIQALAKHFRVLAPDWLGFGKSAKIFNFNDMWLTRVEHIASFMRVLCVENAHFIANSMAGGVLLTVAAMESPVWQIERMIVVSGGGNAPDNAARQTLNSYDGTLDHMRRIVETMFVNPEIRNNPEYIERRHSLSQEPGAWQCTAAARFKSPWGGGKVKRRPESYESIKSPTLIIAGRQDPLREPDYPETLQSKIPRAELVVFQNAGHCAHIDDPARFNRIAIEFLSRTEATSKPVLEFVK